MRQDKWLKRWKVPKSTGDGFWIVALDKSDNYGCSCPRWKFKREQCHHIIAVQTNPAAYDNEQPQPLPEIIPANVECVMIEDGKCLHPLIPIGNTHVLATVVYDLLKVGYSFGQIKARFWFVPKEWTIKAVCEYIENAGRVLCPTSEEDNYIVVGVQ